MYVECHELERKTVRPYFINEAVSVAFVHVNIISLKTNIVYLLEKHLLCRLSLAG